MKIQDIVKQLQKNPQLAEKYDEKYLRSVVEEQLFLRDYKKTFEKELNEDSITDDEEENEIELEPEEIPVEEPEPQKEPEQEPQPEEEELPEPDLDAEPEEEEPEVLPVSKKGEVEVDPSTIPAPKKEIPPQKQDDTSEKEAEQDGYIRISPREAQELLSYKGKIFTAIFTKRSDGSLRSLNGMTGVRKYTSGGELPYSPKDKGLIPVYDLKIGPGPKGYRTIPIEGLKALKINGRKYKIDQSLQEIKINNPIKTWDDVLKLNDKLNNKYPPKLYGEILRSISSELGWKENGQTITTYFKNNPKLIPLFYNKLKQLTQDNIQEIKINKPGGIKFPVDIYRIGINKYIIYKNIKFFGYYYVDEDTGEIDFYIFKDNPLNKKNYHILPKDERNNNGEYIIHEKDYNIIQENMKKDALKQIVKEVLLEVKASKKVIEENKKSSTKLGKDLTKGDILSAGGGQKIISIERNKPLQGKLTVKIEGNNKPLIFDEQSEYGVTVNLEENNPQRSPQRQTPDREVIEKPETDTPERKPKRRTLTPPTESPSTAPKAEGLERNIADKIADRFKKLKK